MSVLNLAISTSRDTATLTSTFETVTGSRAVANRIINFITSVATGTESAMSASVPPTIAVSIRENAVPASGTLTLASVVATNTATINGVVFTAIASGATGNQFNVGADDTATAVNLAAAINASVTALIPGYVTATSALAVVTVASAFYGIGGNQTTLVGSANITASGARLASGAADATAQSLTF